MGNAAGKLLDETELVVGTLEADDAKSIANAFVSTGDETTKIKNKGKTWVRYGDEIPETLLWKSQSVGMVRSHSVILDSTEAPLAIIIVEKKGMASCTNFICKKTPSFDGQKPLTSEELKKAGINYGDETALYKFAKIVCQRTMTTGNCTYGIVTGAEDGDDEILSIKNLYQGEKLASLGFKAIFKEVSGDDPVVVAKAFMPKMSMSPHVDASSGVDLLAIVSMGYALAGDESSAGALAGAGVI